MTDMKLRKLVLAALFAALCTVMTMVIQVPSPMQGYVNLGDCAVLLSAWVLGPWYGGAAAGLGSMLADLLSYPHYAPGTLVIKFTMAVAAAYIFEAMRERSGKLAAQLIGGAAAEIIMVLGYFGYASLWLGKGLAALLGDFRAVAAAGLRGCVGAPLTGDAARRALSLADAAIQRLGAQVNPKIVLSVLAAKLG